MQEHPEADDIIEALEDADDDKAKEVMDKVFDLMKEELKDECEPDFRILKIRKDGEKLQMLEFDSASKAKKKYKKMAKNGHAAVLIKKENVKKIKGEWCVANGLPRTITFLIGTAFGKGWLSDLGPLADPDMEKYCIFDDGDVSDDDGEASGEDDEEEGDGMLHVLWLKPDGNGFNEKEFDKPQKAKKKFNKVKDKGKCVLLTNKRQQIGSKGNGWSFPDDEGQKNKKMNFLFGVAYGKGYLTDDTLGPVAEEGHRLCILDDDFDADED